MYHDLKRRRLHYDDPDADLFEKRARNDLHLKSRFEAIFEKYGKDFSDVGDEIDLKTGSIVVNKGHIQSMAHEQDVGQVINPSSQQLSEYWTASEDLRGSSAYGDAVQNNVSSSVESTVESLMSSDTHVENILSDPAIDLFYQKTRHNAASNLHMLSSQEYSSQDNIRRQPSLPAKTPLRNFDVDGVLHRFHNRRLETYDSPLEPAWQAPPLPKDKVVHKQRHNQAPELNREGEKERSKSPSLVSLWAPPSGRGRRKGDGTPRQTREPTSKLRRSSMPSIGTKAGPLGSPKRSNQKGARFRPWTLEEEKLLRHLRTNTRLTYIQLAPYFPDRNWKGIATHWSKILLPGLRTQREFRADALDAADIVAPKVSGDAIQEDTDIDELQAYEFDSRTVNPGMQSERIRKPPPKSPLSRREAPCSPSSVANVPFADFMDGLHRHLGSAAAEPPARSPSIITPGNLDESNLFPKLQPHSKSIHPKSPVPEPQLVAGPSLVTPVTRGNRKKHNISSQARTASATPSRPLDDFSEDELAIPVTISKRPKLVKVPTGSNSTTVSPKLRDLQLDDGSEDELSTPVPQKIMPRRSLTEVSVSKRRKSSLW